MRRRLSACVAGAMAAAFVSGVAGAQSASGGNAAAQAPAQAAPSAARGGATTSGSSAVTPAKLVHSVAPDYQPAADGSSAGGTVVLKYRIQVDGTVSDVEYVSGPGELKDKAIAAVKQWSYEPARVSGHAVPSDGSVNLVFKGSPPLTNDDADNAEKAVAPVAADATKTAAQVDAATSAAGGEAIGAKPVRVGGNVMAKQLVHQLPPIYPGAAKMAHVQGTVVLHAIIAKDGTIRDLKYVSGPMDLVDSSMTAVKQWRYRPTTLNGQVVEVDTTISIVFKLG